MARQFPRSSIVVLAITVCATVLVAGQARGPARSQPGIGRLDGHPDLHGVWTNDTFTPLERPAEFRDKEFFTREEAAAYVEQQNDRVLAQPKDNISTR